MKTLFRLLLSTVTAAAVLALLYFAHGFYVQESTLGDTVDITVLRCLQILGGLTILLYLRAFIAAVIQLFRQAAKRKKRSAADK